eukprot:CAMPEP_0180457364 /NCGR_PEP_ID=MMETSP1036_2-20121128/21784_1 /TAXON_ID=632150 /ORGANISM="Azadinium spinosum, Strain 3D9" /LENGTH=73 /DNA_ID=CAMNT_0022463969 /DNA_START=257 /DNA_END=478 /DNA_ORIENTATION=-
MGGSFNCRTGRYANHAPDAREAEVTGNLDEMSYRDHQEREHDRGIKGVAPPGPRPKRLHLAAPSCTEHAGGEF